MTFRHGIVLSLLLAAGAPARAGEQEFISLRDLSDVETKYAGFTLPSQTTLHIRALGASAERGRISSKGAGMFAYGWIIDADTRRPVWRMTSDNTGKRRDDREFDGTLTLPAGSYEVYFTAYAFEHRTPFSHIVVNVDHRQKPLFRSDDSKKRGFFSWFKDWFSDDLADRWPDRAKAWGIDLLVDESISSRVESFTPPRALPGTMLRIAGAGDNEYQRRGFTLDGPTTLRIYALGESTGDMEDNAWILDASTRERVWEMSSTGCDHAGGARKNVRCEQTVTLAKGTYVLTYVSDATHSSADWNEEPPDDPLNYGVTIRVADPKDRTKIHESAALDDFRNVIVSLVRVRNDEHRAEGFTLTRESRVRVYAIGERGNGRRSMADYGFIMDARTRERVWVMEVDQTSHAGGSSKNRVVDEVVTLPRGSYLVNYVTDDSHAYDDWNDDPPYDRDHYGITVMGAGDEWTAASVTRYVDEGERNVIARIVRVGDGADRTERFSVDRPTRVRIYAVGEGQNREMFDWGWIEDARTGAVIWEMTYGMTFHAGGGRKNRLVNTTILLDRGEYRLRYRTDDTHAFGDWNVDPPDDQAAWGITLYRDEPSDAPRIPEPPKPPKTPKPGIPPRGKVEVD
jgi:hypothetical protein